MPLFFVISGDEEREKAIEKVRDHLKVVEDQGLVDHKKFFGGDTINIVDIAFGSIFKFLVSIEDMNELKVLEAEKFPRLHAWFNNLRDVPVIKENLPDNEKAVPNFKSIRERMLASS